MNWRLIYNGRCVKNCQRLHAGWKCLFDSKEDNCAETLNTKICSLIEFQSTKELQNINEGAPRDSLSLAFLFKTHGNVKIVTPQNLFDRKVPENIRTVMRTSISCYFMTLLFWFCGNRENLEGEQENLMNIQKDILSPAKGPFDEEGKYSVFISLSLIKSPLPVWQAAKLPILKNTFKQQLFTGTGIAQKVLNMKNLISILLNWIVPIPCSWIKERETSVSKLTLLSQYFVFYFQSSSRAPVKILDKSDHQ